MAAALLAVLLPLTGGLAAPKPGSRRRVRFRTVSGAGSVDVYSDGARVVPALAEAKSRRT